MTKMINNRLQIGSDQGGNFKQKNDGGGFIDNLIVLFIAACHKHETLRRS